MEFYYSGCTEYTNALFIDIFLQYGILNPDVCSSDTLINCVEKEEKII